LGGIRRRAPAGEPREPESVGGGGGGSPQVVALREPNDLNRFVVGGRRREALRVRGILVLDPIYNNVIEEAISRENEFFHAFIKSLSSKYCVKLARDEMFLSGFTLLGVPVVKAENISLRLLAALLVAMGERDRKGRFLGVLRTSEGEVRAFRDARRRVSGVSIANREIGGGDCLHQVKALSMLQGKAVIYRSADL